jgi:ABC-type polar amino acid transport system ATPase subunit
MATERRLIEIRALKKSFGGSPVLRGIDLDVEDAQLTVLIGASGCGKSTLLRCLNGLETADEGEVFLDGITLAFGGSGRGSSQRELAARTHDLRKRVGMVFQAYNLFPHWTVLENVWRPQVIVKAVPPDEARARGRELLGKVGLGERAGHYPRQLSGGQQQRAAIARALAMRPRVILYDEPTSALDPGLADEVLRVMRDLDSEGITQIVVTHEMRFAREVADKVVFLSEGVVAEEGAPDVIFTSPADLRTREFLKRYL